MSLRPGCEQTYQRAKVVPNLGDEGIQADRARVCIKCVPVLVDLVIEHTDRAPECRVPTVSIYRLLIGLISLRELLLGHVAAT